MGYYGRHSRRTEIIRGPSEGCTNYGAGLRNEPTEGRGLHRETGLAKLKEECIDIRSVMSEN